MSFILDFTFRQVMSLSRIKRWSIVDMSKEQSVAEHSYNVAMISIATVDRLAAQLSNAGHDVKLVRSQVLEWSLIHDLPEVVTSDLPTTVKPMLNNAWQNMEDSIFPLYVECYDATKNVSMHIVKMADYIDAIQFCSRYCVDDDKSNILAEMVDRLNAKVYQFEINFDMPIKQKLLGIYDYEKG